MWYTNVALGIVIGNEKNFVLCLLRKVVPAVVLVVLDHVGLTVEVWIHVVAFDQILIAHSTSIAQCQRIVLQWSEQWAPNAYQPVSTAKNLGCAVREAVMYAC